MVAASWRYDRTVIVRDPTVTVGVGAITAVSGDRTRRAPVQVGPRAAPANLALKTQPRGQTERADIRDASESERAREVLQRARRTGRRQAEQVGGSKERGRTSFGRPGSIEAENGQTAPDSER